MLRTGKHSPKTQKPSAVPSGLPAKDQTHGEGSYSGTRDYQEGVKAYLETADVEKDARNAAPHDAIEARDLEKAEETGRKRAEKTQNTSKRK